MTMNIFFKEDFDGYKKGKSYFVERALARRIVRNGKAVTKKQHEDELYEAELAEKKRKEEEIASKKKAEEEKKAKLLRDKAENEKEKTVSEKAFKREKSFKK